MKALTPQFGMLLAIGKTISAQTSPNQKFLLDVNFFQEQICYTYITRVLVVPATSAQDGGGTSPTGDNVPPGFTPGVTTLSDTDTVEPGATPNPSSLSSLSSVAASISSIAASISSIEGQLTDVAPVPTGRLSSLSSALSESLASISSVEASLSSAASSVSSVEEDLTGVAPVPTSEQSGIPPESLSSIISVESSLSSEAEGIASTGSAASSLSSALSSIASAESSLSSEVERTPSVSSIESSVSSVLSSIASVDASLSSVSGVLPVPTEEASSIASMESSLSSVLSEVSSVESSLSSVDPTETPEPSLSSENPSLSSGASSISEEPSLSSEPPAAPTFPCDSEAIILSGNVEKSLSFINLANGAQRPLVESNEDGGGVLPEVTRRQTQAQLGGIGYNILDNYVYGVVFINPPETWQVVRIAVDGSLELLEGTEINTGPVEGGELNVGDIDDQGQFHVSYIGRATWTVDLNPASGNFGSVTGPSSLPPNVGIIQDWAYINGGGPGRFLYSVYQNSAQNTVIARYEIATERWDAGYTFEYGQIGSGTGWGAMFDGGDGRLFAIQEGSGEIWRFIVDGPGDEGNEPVSFASRPGSAEDGARCILAPPINFLPSEPLETGPGPEELQG